MKRKFIAVLLAAAAGSCVFAGCGARENTTHEKPTEPDAVIKREVPNVRMRDLDGFFPVPPEHGIAKPMPLPAPDRYNGFYFK